MQRPDNNVELPKKVIKNKKKNIEFALFCKIMPKNVKLLEHTRQNICLCQKHANIALNLTAAKVLPKSPNELISLSNNNIIQNLNTIDKQYRFDQSQRVMCGLKTK